MIRTGSINNISMGLTIYYRQAAHRKKFSAKKNHKFVVVINFEEFFSYRGKLMERYFPIISFLFFFGSPEIQFRCSKSSLFSVDQFITHPGYHLRVPIHRSSRVFVTLKDNSKLAAYRVILFVWIIHLSQKCHALEFSTE